MPFPDTLQLPSGLTLQLSLTYPEMVKTAGGSEKLAICSHPWSRLGGSMHDPVLKALVKPLSRLGYHVLTFNARGVGDSSGSASWTAFQEGRDLEELVASVRARISHIQEVALIGYSNGCLSTSLHPVLPSPIRTSHIFISYPLGVRSWLTMFNGGTYQTRMEELTRQPNSRVLLAFGDQDEFTGAASYEKWTRALLRDIEEPRTESVATNNDARVGRRLRVSCVPNASHFWGGRALDALVSAIEEFLSSA